jgi:hypothetical protein
MGDEENLVRCRADEPDTGEVDHCKPNKSDDSSGDDR